MTETKKESLSRKIPWPRGGHGQFVELTLYLLQRPKNNWMLLCFAQAREFVPVNVDSSARKKLPDGRGPMPKPILLQQPMSSGIVTDWDDMEQLWRHGIEQEMGLDPVEHPVLMADSTATAPGER